MTKKEKIDFDHYAADYDAILNQQLKFFEPENSYFAEYKVIKAKDIVKTNPKNILDFGCGTGRSTIFLKKHFPSATVYGCDISEKSLAQARLASKEIQFLSLEDIEKSAKGFDFIFVAGVFHHIAPQERQAVFSRLIRLATPGTCIIIFEHNPFNPVTRYLVNTCPFDQDAVLLKPKELKSLFVHAGLRDVQCEYTLFFPGQLKFLRSWERFLRYLPVGGQYLISGLLA